MVGYKGVSTRQLTEYELHLTNIPKLGIWNLTIYEHILLRHREIVRVMANSTACVDIYNFNVVW